MATMAPNADSPGKAYLTQTEAAALLGVTVRTLHNWHRKGTLRGWRPAGGRRGVLLYRVEALQQVAAVEAAGR